MMPNYHDYQIHAQDNQRQKLAAAEQHRLAQEAAPLDASLMAAYKPLLASVGRGMVKLGTRLQARYGSLSEATPMPPIESNTPARKPTT